MATRVKTIASTPQAAQVNNATLLVDLERDQRRRSGIILGTLVIVTAVVVGVLAIINAGRPQTPVPLTNVTYDRPTVIKPGSTTAYLTENTAGSISLNFPKQMTELRAIARGNSCRGAPVLQVLVDGKKVMNQSVDATTSTKYASKLSLPAGHHQVQIKYDNDFSVVRRRYGYCSRNIYLDSLVFIGG